MKKSTIITILSIAAIVPMLMLVFSIKEAKAVQNEINATPEIAKLEPRSYEWGKNYPRQYGRNNGYSPMVHAVRHIPIIITEGQSTDHLERANISIPLGMIVCHTIGSTDSSPLQ